jgi:hypothetical protein
MSGFGLMCRTRQIRWKSGDLTVTFRPLRHGNAGGMFMTGKLEHGKILTSAGAE